MPPVLHDHACAERLQQLQYEHQERLRKLAFKRQQIMQRQALWVGRVDGQAPQHEDDDPEVRDMRPHETVVSQDVKGSQLKGLAGRGDGCEQLRGCK